MTKGSIFYDQARQKLAKHLIFMIRSDWQSKQFFSPTPRFAPFSSALPSNEAENLPLAPPFSPPTAILGESFDGIRRLFFQSARCAFPVQMIPLTGRYPKTRSPPALSPRMAPALSVVRVSAPPHPAREDFGTFLQVCAVYLPLLGYAVERDAQTLNGTLTTDAPGCIAAVRPTLHSRNTPE